MAYTDSRLWNRFVGSSSGFPKLKEAYQNTRNRAATLTGEISQILPDYTVHDIQHLDALWTVADQVCGDEMDLNPLEIFVLGCSFLFHDAGMSFAAYPGGLSEIKKTSTWSKLLIRNGLDESPADKNVERSLLEVFLREQHAIRAIELPKLGWRSATGVYFLLEDGDLRANFGEAIGEISASHWWSHEKIEKEFTTPLNAPFGFPTDWTVDKLKLACILRCSDAANIDQSRAPSFLYALKQGAVNSVSELHWNFQSRMLPAQRRQDALVYGCSYKYARHEANIWWLAYDTMVMVDTELRACDRILARRDNGRFRLAARRVADIDSPSRVSTQIGVTGWLPVDTAYKISDIPSLVEKFGGRSLYGDDLSAPIRELIMNGMDAVRTRRRAENLPLSEAKVSFSIDSYAKGSKLVFEDEGIGISSNGFIDSLLRFGTSSWFDDISFQAESRPPLKKEEISGFFGIGFFSIFMLGQKIRVISRRWDAGLNETFVLEFSEGLSSRPVIYPATGDDRMRHVGTRIEVTTNSNKLESVGNEASSGKLSMGFLGTMFPTSDVLLEINTPVDCGVIDGRNWQTEDPVEFLNRVDPRVSNFFTPASIRQGVQPIRLKDGEIIGRGVLEEVLEVNAGRNREDYIKYYEECGGFTSKGSIIGHGLGFIGTLYGTPIKAARDEARPAFEDFDAVGWLENQLDLIDKRLGKEEKIGDPVDENRPSYDSTQFMRLRLGLKVNTLPFLHVRGQLAGMNEFHELVDIHGEVWWCPLQHRSAFSEFVEIDWFEERIVETCCTSYGIFSPYFIAHERPYGTYDFDHEPSDDEVLCALCSINYEDFEDWQQICDPVKVHIATDVHGRKHFDGVYKLRPNMTKEEFMAVHQENVNS